MITNLAVPPVKAPAVVANVIVKAPQTIPDDGAGSSITTPPVFELAGAVTVK